MRKLLAVLGCFAALFGSLSLLAVTEHNSSFGDQFLSPDISVPMTFLVSLIVTVPQIFPVVVFVAISLLVSLPVSRSVRCEPRLKR